MAESFDAYRKWLGIPPEEQPPHHYRLLGIPLFEDDEYVIESAADQRMSHIRTFANGRFAEISQRLLNELSAAHVCLANAEKKGAYDRELQASLPTGDDESSSIDYSALVGGIAPARSSLSNVRRVKEPLVQLPAGNLRPAWQIGVAIGGVASIVILAIGCAIIFSSGGNNPSIAKSNSDTQPLHSDDTPAKPEVPLKPVKMLPTTTPPATPVPSDVKPPVTPVVTPPVSEPMPKPVEPSVPVTIPEPPVAPPVTPTNPPVAPSNPPGTPPKSRFDLIEITNTPVDMLAEIDPARHGVRGIWQKADGKLLSPVEGNGLIAVPCRPPAQYFVSLVAERRNSNRELVLGLYAQGRSFHSVTDHNYHGLDMVDGKGGLPGPLSHWIPQAAPSSIRLFVLVRKEEVAILQNGEWDVQFRGDFQRLSPLNQFQLPGRPACLSLGTGSCSFVISKLEVASLVDSFLVPPSEAEQRTLDAQIRKTFAEELRAARTNEARLALSQSLQHMALKGLDQPGMAYLTLRLAVELATEAGNALQVWVIAQDLHRLYGVDPYDFATAALEKARQKINKPADARPFAEQAMWILDEFALGHRAKIAQKLVAVVASATAYAAQPQLGKDWADRKKAFQQSSDDLDAEQRLRNILRDSPDDPTANAQLGRILCINQGDWDAGIKHFAAGNQEAFRKLAEQDLTTPRDIDAQGQLAEVWRKASVTSTDPVVKAAFHNRARYWLKRAVNGSAGAARAEFEKKLLEITPGTGLKGEYVKALNVKGVIELQTVYKTRTDKQIAFDWGVGSPDPSVSEDNFGVRWTGCLLVPKSGWYSIVAEADDRMRVALDGEVILDSWATGGPPREKVVFLLSKPYDIRVECADGTGPSKMKLSWQQQAGFKRQPIAPEYFYLDRAQALKALSSVRSASIASVSSPDSP